MINIAPQEAQVKLESLAISFGHRRLEELARTTGSGCSREFLWRETEVSIKNFGRCKRCGRDINPVRLLWSPHVQVCMRCHYEALGLIRRQNLGKVINKNGIKETLGDEFTQLMSQSVKISRYGLKHLGFLCHKS